MKPVVIVVLIIAISTLTAQTLRHAYLRWLQNQDSVLEKYNPIFKDKIKNAKSLEALEKEYAKVQEKVKKADEEAKKSKRKVNRYRDEPFKSERELQGAIKNWERRSEEIRKTRYFWVCGLIITIAGAILFVKWIWFGFSFIVAGLTQMIWWVSPSFSYNEASVEYHRMLENKFFLSLATLILVIILCFLFNNKRHCGENSVPE
jgi:ABC-type multidrug transport system fused ATPase/permease subunit